MSDLISREYMKSLGATCIASRSKDGALFPIVAIDELPSAQPEPHWTPVSEEPPEDGQECLVTAKALNKFCVDTATFTTNLSSVDEYFFRDRKGESGWYFTDPDFGELELPDVVAWMPMPEPWKGEENDT